MTSGSYDRRAPSTASQIITLERMLEEAESRNEELQAKYDAVREVGDRMAMALTYAKSGYICDYRLAWEALQEQADETP